MKHNNNYDYENYEKGHPRITELQEIPEEERDDIWYRMEDLNHQIQDLMESLVGISINDFADEERAEMADRILDAATCELYTQFGIPSWVA